MWGDGDVRKKPLFGDTFAMRTDYTSGTFYRGRRQFLAEGKDDNILEPPSIFKTKRQAKNASRDKQVVIQKLSFPKKDSEGENIQIKSISKKVAEGNKKQIQKKQNQQQHAVVYLPPIVDIRKEDWEYWHQAGCSMWINHITGEIMQECPWEKDEKETGRSQSRADSKGAGSAASDDNDNGTGSLVYDHEELNTLLEYFDKLPH
jgi:hypothetical protein